MRFSGFCRYMGRRAVGVFSHSGAGRRTDSTSRRTDLGPRQGAETLKPRLVAVVDLRPPYDANKVQAHYLAWLLSNTINADRKKKFAVAEHIAFDDDLTRFHLTPEALIPGDAPLLLRSARTC